MTFAERALYHQIHPAKLFADIATALIGIDLFWRHELAPGLIIAVLPPVLVSTVLVREADLDRYARAGGGISAALHAPVGAGATGVRRRARLLPRLPPRTR